jgi:23S rRNA 5-hydroxycytidine C2501 synthase
MVITARGGDGRLAPIELLAPAKNEECGRVAIDCGADAVYIGAPQFGAREDAGNPLDVIAALTAYAHQYWVRVYVTVNTLLYDREIAPAVRLIHDLHKINVDAVIIQDMGLLECQLPAISLFASTQTHNATPEKVAFLEKVGFSRVILARELSLTQIKAIREAAPTVELECFVHGALCVCYSGQCSMSYALGGRSGNRGACAQPCRKPYQLLDEKGQAMGAERHWLSIQDMNRSKAIPELLDAGVTSFKIEGRLKDRAYVANVVAAYRKRVDEALRGRTETRCSSGESTPDFAPDIHKTFNRGYTPYFLYERAEKIGAQDTPTMRGECVGVIVGTAGPRFLLDRPSVLVAGDGICFLDARNRLQGSTVNESADLYFVPEKRSGLKAGVAIYRNHDHAFLHALQKAVPKRQIEIEMAVRLSHQGLEITAADQDGVTVTVCMEEALSEATNPAKAIETIQKQLGKTGASEFACRSVAVKGERVPFIPIAKLNAWRRHVLEALRQERLCKRPVMAASGIHRGIPCPETVLTYQGNVLNEKALAFYQARGAAVQEAAAESGLDLHGRTVMTTKYCIRYERNQCPLHHPHSDQPVPAFLQDQEGHRFRLEYDCNECVMRILFIE